MDVLLVGGAAAAAMAAGGTGAHARRGRGLDRFVAHAALFIDLFDKCP